jgi:hypothetical protein
MNEQNINPLIGGNGLKDEMICYCHNYTADDLEKDAVEHGQSTIMEKIIGESKAGNCNCETNNPKGR